MTFDYKTMAPSKYPALIELIQNKTKLIGLCGRAQSGKNTSVAYLTGLIWRMSRLIENFAINPSGQLVIYDLKGSQFPQGKLFNTSSWDNDDEINNILKVCHPYPLNITQEVAFGDPLKEVCHSMFGLNMDLLYGSAQDKATKTQYTAGQFINLIGSRFPFKQMNGSENLTYRQMMQLVGTEVGRGISPTIWVDRTVERVYHIIKRWSPVVIFVSDIRFENELRTIQSMSGSVIGLTRQRTSAGKTHKSEGVGKLLDKCDYVVDNSEMTIEEQCVAMASVLQQILE